MTPVDPSTPAAKSLAAIARADAGRPFAVAQLGQPLDGRIATLSGESRYINCAEGLDHLHRLRAQVDAIVVGAGTIAADDPQLTVRRASGCNPARVVIDPSARLAPTGRWLESNGAARIIVSGVQSDAPSGVERVVLPARDGGRRPHDFRLHRRRRRRPFASDFWLRDHRLWPAGSYVATAGASCRRPEARDRSLPARPQRFPVRLRFARGD